jgi:MFS family permease
MKLRWYDHISINLLWLAINVRNNAVGGLFLPYLVDLFAREEIKNTALGGLRTAGLIVAMLAQPAFGLLSDRSVSRFGRRRPFFFLGILLDLVFLAALAFAWDYPSLVVAVLLLQVSSNMSHGPLQALIPDLVPERQRGVSSAVKAIFELLPLILVGFTIARLVSQGRFDLAVMAVGAAILVIMLTSLLLVREQPLREKPNIPFGPPMLRVLGMLAGLIAGALAGLAGGALLGGLGGLAIWPLLGERAARVAGVSLGALVAMLIAVTAGVRAGVRATLGKTTSVAQAGQREQFTWWITNRLLFLAAITSLQSFAPFFFMFAFRIDRDAAAGMTGSLMTMVGLFTLATALPGGWLADRYGHRRVIAASGLAAALASFLLLATTLLPSMTLIYGIGAILGLATGLFMSSNWALGTNLVPQGEAGRYMGISNLAGAGAGIVGTGLGGPIADYLNGITPGLGYFVLFGCYEMLFLASAASVTRIRQPLPAGVVPESARP